jgi:hypothetical protein
LYGFTKIENPQAKQESFKYEEGKSYINIDDEMIFVEYRMKLPEKYTECALILMTNYFVLLRKSVVEKRVHYDEYIPLADKSDNRRLFLNGEKETVWLQLRDATTAQSLLKHLEEGRSVLMRYKLSQLVKEVEMFRTIAA